VLSGQEAVAVDTGLTENSVRISTLRAEIERAAKRTRVVRFCVAVAVFIPLTALALLGGLWFAIAPVEYYQRHVWQAVAVALASSVLWAVLPVAVAVALGTAVAFRHRRCQGLKEELAAVDGSTRRAVLIPLREARSGDARKIAEILLSEHGLDTAPLRHGVSGPAGGSDGQ
jgi:hypothetical protein